MFALTSWEENPLQLTLKCDPDDAQILRSMYTAVKPGYHMNKEHWNTITLDDSIPDEILERLIRESYQLVLGKLPGKVRDKLG